MKITIITGACFPVPPVRGGAIPRMWLGLAREFARMRNDVRIIARAYEGQAEYDQLDGIDIQRVGGFDQSGSLLRDIVKDLGYAIRLLPVLPRSDVLVINDLCLPFFAGLLRRSAGRVVVSAERFPKKQFSYYPRVRLICAPSRAVARAIRNQSPSVASRVAVVPNPVDISVFSPKNRWTEPVSHVARLLYVGRVHPEKGLDLLLDAIRLLKHDQMVELDIVGPVATDQGGGGREYLQKLMQKLDRRFSIRFHEPEFDEAKLAVHMRNADLFCYPSVADKGEAFGSAALEAMACGAIPLVSALECFQDFIQSGYNGYVFDHRQAAPEQQLSRVLEQALSARDDWPAISMHARMTAEKYSFQLVAQQFNDLFEGIA